MKILIVGAGALGSLFGGLLARTGQDVSLYNCSFVEHIEAIRARGLILQIEGNEERISIPAFARLQELRGPMDLVGIFVKAYDTEQAIQDARPLIDQQTWVLSLQNGLGIEKALSRFIPKAQMVRGVTAQGATVVAPGVIRWAGRGPTFLGTLAPLNSQKQQQIRDILVMFNRAGIETHFETHIEQRVWEKLLINAAINPLTALFEVPNGALVEDPTLRAVLADVVKEALPIVTAHGLTLSLEEALQRVEQVCRATSKNLSSMFQDVRRRKRTEVEFINGALAAEGERLNLPTPLHRLLSELIRRKSARSPFCLLI